MMQDGEIEWEREAMIESRERGAPALGERILCGLEAGGIARAWRCDLDRRRAGRCRGVAERVRGALGRIEQCASP